MPTSSASGTRPGAARPRISCSTPGAILQPQPPPCEKEVSRNGTGSGAFTSKTFAWSRVDGGLRNVPHSSVPNRFFAEDGENRTPRCENPTDNKPLTQVPLSLWEQQA